MTDTGVVAMHPYIDGSDQFVPDSFVDEVERIAEEYDVYCVEQTKRTGVRPREELAGQEFYDGFFQDVKGEGMLSRQDAGDIQEKDVVYMLGGKASVCVPKGARSLGRYGKVCVDPGLTYEPLEGEFMTVAEVQDDDMMKDEAVFRPLYFSGAAFEALDGR
ncbi:MAG: hypothetical protein ABEI58_03390 [Candidatus Nanohaloarchaea archaeon]